MNAMSAARPGNVRLELLAGCDEAACVWALARFGKEGSASNGTLFTAAVTRDLPIA
jgi:hypothetical protein